MVIDDDEEEKQQHLFMDFFSPPRVAIPLRREGFLAVHSFDIMTGYDFLTADSRARALKLQSRHRPFFTMLSAPCTMYSPMQNANLGKMDLATKKRRWSEAHCLLDYSMLVAKRQHAQKRFFAHEHPQKATSWKRQSVKDLEEEEDVMKVSFDQCRVNLRTPVSKKPLQKRTTLLTNSAAIVDCSSLCNAPAQKNMPPLRAAREASNCRSGARCIHPSLWTSCRRLFAWNGSVISRLPASNETVECRNVHLSQAAVKFSER